MIENLRGTLIVSCQALPDEPLYGSDIMAKMALACVLGGASAIRANSVSDINAIRKTIDVPIIGLIKKDYPDSEVYITPTRKEVEELISSACEIIAIDATNRPRPNGEKLEDLLALIKASGKIALADVSTFEEGVNAEKLGFDLVSTTLSGYTSYSKKLIGPDIKLVKRLVKSLNIGVIAEGRISNEKDLKKIIKAKPFAIVIGSAITRPLLITKNYVNTLEKYKKYLN